MRMSRFFLALAFVSAASWLTACAEMPKSPEAQAEALEVNDPLEPMNRVIFVVKDFLDRLLFNPITELCRFVVPDYPRERIANVVSNMGEPVTFANNMLQGETSRAGITAERFTVNTLAGVGGIFEVADDLDLYKQQGDFGQTLSVWGVGSGPYLVLPFFGPSNIRDAVGLGVDTIMSPWQWIAADGGREVKNDLVYSYFAADGLTRREAVLDEYEALRAGSLDFYAQMRSIYRQYRDKQLGLVSPDASKGFDFTE